MPNPTNISEVYAAIERILAQALDAAGGTPVKVQALTDKHFDAQGAIVADPPAVLLVFRASKFSAQNLTADLYDEAQDFSAIVGARNLRGTDEERTGALELLGVVCDALAGARPLLVNTPYKPQCSLAGISLVQFDDRGTWYELQFAAANASQFTAKN